MNNLLTELPHDLSQEVFETLFTGKQVRVERIVSNGHSTPEGDWYDQDEHEWVLVLAGDAELEYDDGNVIPLQVGSCVNIPAHQKHRVKYTSNSCPTVWLAIFYS